LNNFSINSTPVYREDGKFVALVENGVLIKHVRRSKHMLQKPQGWAWDDTCLEQAERLQAHQTQIFDDETGLIYTASISDFRRYGVQFNRHFGQQTCLPVKYWQVSKLGENPPIQLSLFG